MYKYTFSAVRVNGKISDWFSTIVGVLQGCVLSSLLFIIIARRVCIARTMPWQDFCLSVCLYVCHTPVFCLNSYTYPQSFFTIG